MYEAFDSDSHYVRRSLTSALVSFVIGLLLVVIPYETLKDILFTLLGIGIIIMNIIPCIVYWMRYDKDRTVLLPALLSTVSVVIGFIFIFWHHWIVSILLGVWLIVLPIVRIVRAVDKKEQLKKEIPFFLIAVLLFFVPADKIFEIVLKVIGGIIMLFSVIDAIYTLAVNRKRKNKDKGGSDGSSQNTDRVIIDAEVKDIK